MVIEMRSVGDPSSDIIGLPGLFLLWNFGKT